MDDVATVRPPVFNKAGDVALITAVPDSSPTSQETVDLVADIRARGEEVERDNGARVMVTRHDRLMGGEHRGSPGESAQGREENVLADGAAHHLKGVLGDLGGVFGTTDECVGAGTVHREPVCNQ